MRVACFPFATASYVAVGIAGNGSNTGTFRTGRCNARSREFRARPATDTYVIAFRITVST
jgi:hypothetical protein